MPYPRDEQGYIDRKKIVYYLLKVFGFPYKDIESTLDDMTLGELSDLFECHYEEEKRQYETLAHTISVGYVRTKSKKKIELFEKPSTKRTARRSKVDDIERLKNIFGSA